MPAPIPVSSGQIANPPNQSTIFETVQQLAKKIEMLERASRLRSASIGSGGLTLYDSGSIYFFLEGGDGYPGRIFTELASGNRYLRIYGPSNDAEDDANDARISIQGKSPGEEPRVFVIAEGGDVILDAAAIGILSDDIFFATALASTGSSANLNYNPADGRVSQVVSSLRYKQDVTDAEINPADVLALRPRTWRDRSEVAGEKRQSPFTEKAVTTSAPTYIGLIAEELHALDSMRQFVRYDNRGRPDAIDYDRLPVALVVVIKAQQKKIDSQEKKSQSQQEQIDALEKKVAAQQREIDTIKEQLKPNKKKVG